MTKKRGNKEGSIFKQSNGGWRGQVSHEGHRQSKTFPTQRECIDWVRKNRNQISDGMSYASTQLTLGEYLDGWLINKKATRRYATWVHYEWLARGFIIPVLGDMKLKDLRASHIQELYNHLLKSGTGIPTIRKIHAVMNCAMNQAVKQEVIIRNPVNLVDPPQKPHHEMVILSETQISQLLVAAKYHRLEALFHLAITSGMRESELLGLKWKDLDWVKQTVKVERQLERPHGDGIQFTQPKTTNGKRSIKLGCKSIEVLRNHYDRQQEERITAGASWEEHDLIFPTKVGMPIHQRSIMRSFKLLLLEAGLPPFRFHDLRHTAASLLLNNGVPVIIVSRRLGHARASITSDVYGHLLPNMQDEAAELIDDLVTPAEVKLDDPILVSK
jgi:integrase